MSTVGSINLAALEDAMQHDLENQDFDYWFEQLSEVCFHSQLHTKYNNTFSWKWKEQSHQKY